MGNVACNEFCQLECKRNLDCVTVTVQREALLAEIRQSLSDGRGPFHRHDDRCGNATLYVPRAEPE